MATSVSGRTLGAVEFVAAAPRAAAVPADDRPEVAFAGRSNAGKSSALNAICGRRKLARTSKTPGRTQMLVFFDLAAFAPGGARLVDLPGYGYAKVPPTVRAAWRGLMEGYLGGRRSLRGLVLVLDARRGVTPFDCQLLDWGGAFALPFHLLLTKADKLSHSERSRTLAAVQAAYPQHGAQLFSATRNLGLEQARERVVSWLAAPAPAPPVA